MKRETCALLLFAVLAACVPLAVAQDQSDDHWTGTWKYNYDKSTHDEESATKMTRTHERVGDRMKFTREAISAHGEPQHSVYIVKFDGKDYHAEGSPTGGTVSYRRIDGNTLECISKSPNGNSLKQVLVLAKDGKSFVLTETGKYGNAKVANHYSFFEKQ
jgi:hypothetical protein